MKEIAPKILYNSLCCDQSICSLIFARNRKRQRFSLGETNITSKQGALVDLIQLTSNCVKSLHIGVITKFLRDKYHANDKVKENLGKKMHQTFKIIPAYVMKLVPMRIIIQETIKIP